MAVGGVIHTDWLNENSNRKYPFFDGAALTDTSGAMTLPNELIVDLVFPVHALNYDLTRFHLYEIVVYGGGVTVTLGYDGVPIATRSVVEDEHVDNTTYTIAGVGDFADSIGRITVGRIRSIKRFGGAYRFSAANARLLPTVLRPSLQGVSAFRVVTADGDVSDLIQGDIELLTGENINFVVTTVNGVKQLKISAINNPNYEQDCECEDGTTGEPIRTINGVGPDESGNFTLEGIGCVEIVPIANGARINDTCAEPCCGCSELEVLRNEVARLGAQLATQQAFAQRAMSSIEQMRDVILASKFGSVNPC